MSSKIITVSMNWLRQTKEPLFPDLLWSRPENKRYAGKLLIIGGHAQSFSAVSEAYAAAAKAGIGTAKVILPDKLQKMLSGVFPEAEYAASTLIGSFSRQALDALLEAAAWADGVLLAGDFGRNSETAVLLESFVNKSGVQITLAGDSIDYFLPRPPVLIDRESTLIVTTVAKLQKLAQPNFIRQQDDLAQMVNKLGIFTDGIKANIVTWNSGNVIVATRGKVSTTAVKDSREGDLAAYVSVWRLQQPEHAFETLTTAAYCYAKD